MTARALLRSFFDHHATSRAFYHVVCVLWFRFWKFPAAMRADNSPGPYRFLAIWAFDIASVFQFFFFLFVRLTNNQGVGNSYNEQAYTVYIPQYETTPFVTCDERGNQRKT